MSAKVVESIKQLSNNVLSSHRACEWRMEEADAAPVFTSGHARGQDCQETGQSRYHNDHIGQEKWWLAGSSLGANLKLPRLRRWCQDGTSPAFPSASRPTPEHHALHRRPWARDNLTTDERTGSLELDWQVAGMCESRKKVALRSCGPARLPQLMLPPSRVSGILTSPEQHVDLVARIRRLLYQTLHVRLTTIGTVSRQV